MTPEENSKKLLEIENRLGEMKQQNDSKQLTAVFDELKDLQVLVAILIDDPAKAKQLEEEARAKGEPLKLTPDIKTRPLLVKNAEGLSFIGIYTSPSQIPAKVEKNGILTMPFAHVLQFANNSKGAVAGAVINPFSHNVIVRTGVNKTVGQGKAITPEQAHGLARTNVEYVLFPREIYTKGKEYIDAISEEVLYNLFKEQYSTNGLSNPYKQNMFDVMSYGIRADMDLVSIGMPSINIQEGTCSRIYVTYNTEKNEAGYYMIANKSGANKLLFINNQGHMTELGDAPAESLELTTILEKEDERNNG